MKQYFEILGLPESASYEEVKNARIRLLKEYHPDLYAGSKKYAELKSSEINIAFENLTKYFENRNCFSGKILEYKKEVNQKSKEHSNETKEKDVNIKKEKKELDKKGDKKLLDIFIYILASILIILLFVIVFS